MLSTKQSYMSVRISQMRARMKPSFSNDFISWLAGKTIEKIRERLLKDQQTLELFDDLIILLYFMLSIKGRMTTGDKDDYVTESIGRLSYLIKFNA